MSIVVMTSAYDVCQITFDRDLSFAFNVDEEKTHRHSRKDETNHGNKNIRQERRGICISHLKGSLNNDERYETLRQS